MKKLLAVLVVVFVVVFTGCDSEYDELENAIEQQESTGNEEDPVEKADPRNG